MGNILAGKQNTGTLRHRIGRWFAAAGQFPKISTGFLLIIVVCAIFAGQVAPEHPTKVNFNHSYTPPFWQEGGSLQRVLGADELGRDLLTRIIHGARISLIVGLGAVLVTAVVGTVVGIASGYFGGRIDSALSALIDVWLSIPPILFLLLLALVIGRSLPGIIIALTVLSWPRYARIVRGQVLTIKERDFVALAKVSGSSPQRIMLVHILPNVVNSVLVLGTLDVGRFIVLESSLSFLGLGVQPPAPAWGVMISDARNQLQIAWWTAIMPGLALVATVLSANSFGDWLRDKLDPIRRAN
jgi:peptide/nickel transport system permease protein